MKNNKILILLISCLVALLSACKPVPEMSVKVQNGDIVFDLDREKANGFLNLLVQDERTGDDLWNVNLSYFPGGKFKYGEVPAPFTTWNGNPGRAREAAPATPLPPTPVKVTLTYQFRSFTMDFHHIRLSTCRAYPGASSQRR